MFPFIDALRTWAYGLSGKNTLEIHDDAIALHLDVAPGELVAVIGAKGAGKSSFCANLCGIRSPYYRKVCIGDTLINPMQKPDVISDPRMIFSSDRILIQSLTVAENICMGKSTGRMFNWNRINADAKEALSKIGVDTISFEAKADDLPPWQKVLVRLARAVADNAGIIILDEVAVNFDTVTLPVLFDAIRRIKEMKIIVFYVPYRIEEIAEIAEKVAIIYRGSNSGELLSLKNVSYEQIINRMMGQDHPETPIPDYFMEKFRITDREKEIILLISNGYSNQYIAGHFDLSIGTVKNHIYNIFQKTHVKNRVELCNLLRVK